MVAGAWEVAAAEVEEVVATAQHELQAGVHVPCYLSGELLHPFATS